MRAKRHARKHEPLEWKNVQAYMFLRMAFGWNAKDLAEHFRDICQQAVADIEHKGFNWDPSRMSGSYKEWIFVTDKP